MIGAQPPQAGLEIGSDSGRRTVLVPRAVGPPDGAALGEDRDLVATTTQRFTDDLLGPSPTVERGGVDPIDADVERGQDRGDRRVAILWTPPQRTVRQRPHRCRPDADPTPQPDHHIMIPPSARPNVSTDARPERHGQTRRAPR